MFDRGSPRLVILGLVTAAAIVCCSCSPTANTGSDAGSNAPGSNSEGTAVRVTEKNYVIALSAAAIAAGVLSFQVTNQSPDPHEFIVFKTDAPPDALPTDHSVDVDEQAASLQSVGRLTVVPAGSTRTLTMTLSPGSYVAISNLAREYALGMRAGFTVTGPGNGSARDPSASTGAGGRFIPATENDFAIALSAEKTPAGSTTFEVTNTGSTMHEFVILKTDLAPDALPLDQGSVVESAPGVTPVGGVSGLRPGAHKAVTVNLEPGNYVIICNVPGHYALGMNTGLRVSS
jgi:uncharacterized cupredoxin-like copper-binding protein